MPRVSTLTRSLLSDQRGGVVVLFALVSSVLFAFGALAVDAGHLYVAKSRLQGTANAAALAAVLDLPDETVGHGKAISYANKNMSPSTYGHVLNTSDIVFGQWDDETRTFTPGTSPADAVRVSVQQSAANGNPAPTFFASLMGFDEVDIVTEAVAVAGRPATCLLALNPTKKSALTVNNGTLQTNGCTVHSNSDDTTGITVAQGSSIAVTDPGEICVAGGYGGNGSYSPTPTTDCEVMSDPLASLPEPTYGACDHTTTYVVPAGGPHTVTPGVYCKGIDMTSGGHAVFEPGLYVFDDFFMSTAATIEGDGVTFYFTDDSTAKLVLNGENSIELSAPTTGEYAGILIFGSRNSSPNKKHMITGSSTTYLEGTIYLSSALEITGSSFTTVAPYTVIIADSFKFSGQGTFIVGSDVAGSTVPLPQGLAGTSNRLVM